MLNISKPSKFYPRDIIALVTLIFCFVLMALGINHLVSGIIIMVVTFYFARRIDGEGEPEKDINQRVKKLENNKPKFLRFKDVPKPKINNIINPKEPLTTGDFKPLSVVRP